MVSEPPRVVWSEATHAEFARDFRAATAALLLCLHRLGAPRDPGADDRGCLYLPPALVWRLRRSQRLAWRCAQAPALRCCCGLSRHCSQHLCC